jgi:hypothetical protein
MQNKKKNSKHMELSRKPPLNNMAYLSSQPSHTAVILKVKFLNALLWE